MLGNGTQTAVLLQLWIGRADLLMLAAEGRVVHADNYLSCEAVTVKSCGGSVCMVLVTLACYILPRAGLVACVGTVHGR